VAGIDGVPNDERAAGKRRMSKSPEERRAALHGWLEGLTEDPPKGVAQAEQFLELAGDLFDEGHLDGEQYSNVYDVGRALKAPGTPKLDDLARRCLKTLP
jgi:hypothetical protein